MSNSFTLCSTLIKMLKNTEKCWLWAYTFMLPCVCPVFCFVCRLWQCDRTTFVKLYCQCCAGGQARAGSQGTSSSLFVFTWTSAQQHRAHTTPASLISVTHPWRILCHVSPAVTGTWHSHHTAQLRLCLKCTTYKHGYKANQWYKVLNDLFLLTKTNMVSLKTTKTILWH